MFKSVIEAPGGIIALSEEGTLYFGQWYKVNEADTLPSFQWLEIPPLPPNVKEYPTFSLPTVPVTAKSQRKQDRRP